MSVTVNRRDISLAEESEAITIIKRLTYWTASLDGRLSTREDVSISRRGDTSSEALRNLEQAIEEQGWLIT